MVGWHGLVAWRNLEDVEFDLLLYGHEGELLGQAPCVEDWVSQLVGVVFVVTNE